jgi:hypothetical protein
LATLPIIPSPGLSCANWLEVVDEFQSEVEERLDSAHANGKVTEKAMMETAASSVPEKGEEQTNT